MKSAGASAACDRPSCSLSSLDFEEVVARQKTGAWAELAALLADAARRLEDAGADCILIGTNTMHRVADEVQAALSIPLLHIADATAAAIRDAGCRSVALLGTRYTMEQPFYVRHLARHGIECVIPDPAGRAEVHRVIFDELCKGDVDDRSRERLKRIVRRQTAAGAQGVVLACTELSLTLSQGDVDVPLFDTTALHALAAVDFALGSARPPLCAVRDADGAAVRIERTTFRFLQAHRVGRLDTGAKGSTGRADQELAPVAALEGDQEAQPVRRSSRGTIVRSRRQQTLTHPDYSRQRHTGQVLAYRHLAGEIRAHSVDIRRFVIAWAAGDEVSQHDSLRVRLRARVPICSGVLWSSTMWRI